MNFTITGRQQTARRTRSKRVIDYSTIQPSLLAHADEI